ncbi:hypothetical protein H0H92_015321, partial [Tricholoma furcatifolium]
GEKVGPPTEKVEKILDKKKKILVEKTEKLEEKGTAGVQFTPAQELKSSSKRNKVKVKDDKPFTETKSPEGTGGPRVLRDRPIPPPVSGLTFDPRMPPEWNEMVAVLHAREEDKWSSRTRNAYRNATDDEISEPSEFEYSPTGTVTRLNVVDDTDVHLRALREKFEKNFPMKEQVEEPPRIPWKDKGKWKSPSPQLSEEDIPRLRQQWCDSYADIVNGTKEELPPWREVNHEINLIDESK